jgi:pseudaminic acid cytidylyltransferase
MRALAIIPARGGSKRIPRKNIKPFLGKPIISYSIRAAIDCGLFDEVMVSTDDEEIAQIAIKNGATVPFMRSKKNADDFATTSDVLIEVIEFYRLNNIHFDYACCLYPTAPLISPTKLNEAFEKLTATTFDAVFPVIRFSYPILRSLKMTDGKVQLNWPEYINHRSQDLPPAFHDSGQFYWIKVNTFLKTKNIISDNCGGIEISEMEAQDIDNEMDWKLAELKYQLANNNIHHNK